MKHSNATFKKRCTSFMVVVSFFALALPAAKAQELIINPGFSEGTTGWNTNCTIEINPQSVYGGSGSNPTAEIDVERCFNQRVCILGGADYQFSFKASRRNAAQTPATVGMTVKVTGIQSGTEYINANYQYSNTSFNFTSQNIAFNIPLSSGDKQVNVQFLNYENTGTYGVLVDDISLAPAALLSIAGPDLATVNIGSNFSILNAPASGISYSWNFAANSNPGTSVAETPTNIIWTTAGNKMITATVSNGLCTVALLSKNIVVTSLLPITLTSFKGKMEGEKAVLSWVAANEDNDGKYFLIERSGASGVFDSIGKLVVTASSLSTAYSFTDKLPLPGINNYRLKLMNTNASFTYSKIISLTVVKKESVKVYPNPAMSSLGFKISGAKQSEVFVQIYDAVGRISIARKQNLSAGAKEYSIDISLLNPGSYFLRVVSSDEVFTVQSFCKK